MYMSSSKESKLCVDAEPTLDESCDADSWPFESKSSGLKFKSKLSRFI